MPCTAHTAPELIRERANADLPSMGLTSWKHAAAGPIRKPDVAVAKNYLSQDELTELNRIVTMYLDFAEDQAQRRTVMHMADWVDRLDAFLRFNEREVLGTAGSVTTKLASTHASEQYEIWREQQRAIEANEVNDQFLREASEIADDE